MKLNSAYDASLSFDSPVGRIQVYANEGKLVGLNMCQRIVADRGSDPVLVEAKRQLLEYFSGKRRVFELPYSLAGTKFQQAVWEQIAAIDYGATKSYGEIALAIGNPAASRAVGGAVGSNPLPLVVACHRVMGSTGRITGYSGGDGVPTKRALLALEQIESRD